MGLPLVIAFNKCDLAENDFYTVWLKDFDELQSALDNDNEYIATFSRSLALVLEEFYKTIEYSSVSSKTGSGFKELIEKIEKMASSTD